MSRENMVSFRGIKKTYGDKVIIENIDLDIEKGEFVTVIGSSGGGKTTLLKMINGLIKPDSGSVLVAGSDIRSINLIELRRNIGYAIQGSILFPHMSVEKNIAYVPNLINKGSREKTRKAVRKWVDIVGLDKEILKRYPDELSGGQQQRVGIARALAASPELLLMDEPFGAVDEITRSQLQEEIQKIHQKTGVTIIFVTHDIKEAFKLGTRVLIIDNGQVLQFDTPEAIQAAPGSDYVRQLISMGE